MQVQLMFLVFATAYIATALPVEDERYPRFIEFSDEEGNIHTVDLEEQPHEAVLSEITRNPANNLYLLVTRRNPTVPQTLTIHDVDSIRNSNFDPKLPVAVVVHGWLNNQNSGINSYITEALLGSDDVNVIIMDWRRLAISGYVTAAAGVPAVGRGLGQFLEFLHEVTKVEYSKMHLIGFSLGAHVVGNAGRALRGQVARITGLDPAGPLWQYNSDRISSSDGRYVEGIHTDGNALGYGIGKAIGHADFFPNGGNSQPGCITNVCDHNRSWELFGSSVTNNHLAGVGCSSSTQISLNTCRGNIFLMGNDDLSKYGTGMYRVNTGRRYPF